MPKTHHPLSLVSNDNSSVVRNALKVVVRNVSKVLLERLVGYRYWNGKSTGMIIGTEMREWRITGIRTGICASMECWNIGILGAALDLETCI